MIARLISAWRFRRALDLEAKADALDRQAMLARRAAKRARWQASTLFALAKRS